MAARHVPRTTSKKKESSTKTESTETTQQRRRDDDPVRVYRDGRVFYWTSGVPGVGERVGERNPPGDAAKERGEQLRKQLRFVAAGGSLPLEATLDEMFQDFLDDKRRAGDPEGTIRQYKSDYRWVPETVGKVRTVALAPMHLAGIYSEMVDEGCSSDRLVAIQRTLNAGTAWGVENRYFGDAEPWGGHAQRTGVFKREFKRAERNVASRLLANDDQDSFTIDTVPSWNDINAYADALEKIWPGYGRNFVLLSAGSGARLLEAAAWREGDLEDPTDIRIDWQVNRYDAFPSLALPKGGKQRGTIMWSFLEDTRKDALVLAVDGEHFTWKDDVDKKRRVRDRGRLVFPRWSPAKGEPFPMRRWADELGKMATAAHDAAGWTERGWDSHHWTRHHFGTWSLAEKLHGGHERPLTSVQGWMGHANPTITRNTYGSHQLPGPNEEAFAATAHPPGTPR